MGSWYSTCGVTQLPIKDYEKIALFIIQRTTVPLLGSGFTYSDKIFTPLTIPLIGEADDTGGICRITENSEVVFEHMLLLDKLGTIVFKDEKPSNIEDLLRLIKYDKVEGVGFMLVHYDAYKLMVDEVGNRATYNIKESCFNNDTFRQRKLTLMREYMTYNTYDKIRAGLMAYDVAFEAQVDRYIPKKIQSYLHRIKEGRLTSIVKGGNTENTIIDFMLFIVAMELARKTWCIQGGAGSMESEYWLPKLLGEFVISREAKVYTDYLEENIVEMEELKDMTKECIEWYDKD